MTKELEWGHTLAGAVREGLSEKVTLGLSPE